MAISYIVMNCAQPTTAAPVKQPTGTAIRTMLQLRFATGSRLHHALGVQLRRLRGGATWASRVVRDEHGGDNEQRARRRRRDALQPV